jgi:predicted transposase YbfD/YdcC
LRQFLPFAHGIASHDTFGRVFALLNATVFERCFIDWMRTVCGAFDGLQVAVDGKTVRRSQTKGQKAIAAKIIQQESDYALLVKNNQPGLAAAIEGAFDAAERVGYQDVSHTRAEWIEKDHGRIETRHCTVLDDLSGVIDRLDGWAGAKTLLRVDCTRECNGELSTDRRYYLCSRQADAAALGRVVRGHWGVENNLHWSLDVAFGEDQARMRQGNAAENFSILRRIALNLFRQDRSVKAGIKNRLLLAASDDAYRLKLLSRQAVA